MAARDAGDVEQVVHQARQVARVPLDDLLLASGGRMAREQLDRGQDGRERVAELVPEHRQKVVLAARGLEHVRGLERRADEVRRAAHEHAVRLGIQRCCATGDQAPRFGSDGKLGLEAPELAGARNDERRAPSRRRPRARRGLAPSVVGRDGLTVAAWRARWAAIRGAEVDESQLSAVGSASSTISSVSSGERPMHIDGSAFSAARSRMQR